MARTLQGNLQEKDIETAIDISIALIKEVGGCLYEEAYPSFNNDELKQSFQGAFILAVQERLNENYKIATLASES